MPQTPITLFRLGNASGPRMDNVRPKDIELFDVDGQAWVRAGSGGVSTSAVPGPLAGIWWRLAAGFDYGYLLLVWNDHDDHWSWEPVDDMPLVDFQVQLRTTHSHFIRV